VYCEQCNNPLDAMKIRYFFYTGTEVCRNFCDKTCYEYYMNDAILCSFCINPTPTTYINAMGYARFCDYTCLSKCSTSLIPNTDRCLNCKKVSTEPVLNALQHRLGMGDGFEHCCSLKCKINFKIPFGAQMYDDHRN